MSFFKAFLCSCRGPYSFIKLRRQSGWRVVLHLFLTILISCTFIAIGRYFALKYFWSRSEQLFSEKFGGGIKISSSGMLPEKNPAVSRNQELPYDGLLIYISPGSAKPYFPDETLEKRNYILIWTPGHIAFALRDINKNRWSVASFDGGNRVNVPNIMPADQSRGKLGLTLAEFKNEILQIAGKPLPAAFKQEQFKKEILLPTDALFKMMRGTMAVINGFAYFHLTVLMVFFGVCIYMVIFWLAEKFPGADRRISVREMWKIVCYAACPVIIVVNLFPMLQLPFESLYEKIFLVAWVIYVNVIKRWLEKHSDLLEEQEVK